jgi:hypothetical protein
LHLGGLDGCRIWRGQDCLAKLATIISEASHSEAFQTIEYVVTNFNTVQDKVTLFGEPGDSEEILVFPETACPKQVISRINALVACY